MWQKFLYFLNTKKGLNIIESSKYLTLLSNYLIYHI